MTCISNQCEILVMTRILQQMRNIGDDAHFQEMRNELSKKSSQRHGFCSCKSSNSWHHEIVTRSGAHPRLTLHALLPREPRWSAPRRRLPQPNGALPYSRVLGLCYSLQRADMLMGSAVGLVAIAIVLGSLFATKWGHNPTPLTGTSAIADLSVDLFVQLYELDSAPVGPKKISGNERLAQKCHTSRFVGLTARRGSSSAAIFTTEDLAQDVPMATASRRMPRRIGDAISGQ
jgi:hypothetical protein